MEQSTGNSLLCASPAAVGCCALHTTACWCQRVVVHCTPKHVDVWSGCPPSVFTVTRNHSPGSWLSSALYIWWKELFTLTAAGEISAIHGHSIFQTWHLLTCNKYKSSYQYIWKHGTWKQTRKHDRHRHQIRKSENTLIYFDGDTFTL